MEILFMVFMIFVSIMCLFCVLVVIRDIVKETMSKKHVETKVEIVEKKEEPKKEENPVAVAVVEEEVVATEVETEDEEGKISFSASAKQTIAEKYEALSAKDKRRYDEIVNYAKNVEGARAYKNDRYEEYKVGKNRLVRMLIKRGVIHCEFILQNSDFKNFVNENKISVKQAATILKIEDENSVSVAKSSIDIAINAINEEKEYKKQLAREKRRAKNNKK